MTTTHPNAQQEHSAAPMSLAVVDPSGLPRAPLPTYSPADMIAALTAYRALQQALDRAMPDQLLAIGDRQFRKKGYWRAIAVAFHLSVEPLSERREVQGLFGDGRENFGWLVTYRATTPNGRAAIGDGAAFAIEKAGRFRCPHPHPTRDGKTLHYPSESCPSFDPAHAWRTLPATASEHFIRSHAHTRAYSRAVSNLVGFAETPAEEVDDQASDDRPARSRRQRPPRPDAATIDAAQQKRIFDRWEEAGGTDRAALREWFTRQGISDTSRIRCVDYDDLVTQLLIDRPGAGAPAPVDRDPRIHRALTTRSLELGDAPHKEG